VTAVVYMTGAVEGLGLFIVIRALVPDRPQLAAALDRMAGIGLASPPGSRKARAARQLARVTPWLPVPEEDLQLLGQDREAWLASKLIGGVLGLAAPACAAALLALSGEHLPVAVPTLASLVCGATMFMVPDLVVRFSADTKRDDFRHALTSYLDLVSLMRSAGAAPTEALEAAAEIGEGWAFAQLHEALGHARRTGEAPWAGLAGLADRNGVPDLADIADIAGIAGQEGAKILDTLMARAESMRARQLADSHATTTSRTTTMAIPVALMASGFLVLLIYPMISRLFAAG
jgi:Flp pilus assembly protein TadB